uniref:MRG domain-containing protein n=1 Tax=Trichuris muris TaxID=70415 RepID=A0A5S6QCU5_TRIMR
MSTKRSDVSFLQDMRKQCQPKKDISYQVGDTVECKYKNVWYKAKIIDTVRRGNRQLFTVHYVGWGKHWDESVLPCRLRKQASKKATPRKVRKKDPIERLKQIIKRCVTTPGKGIPKLNEPVITGKSRARRSGKVVKVQRNRQRRRRRRISTRTAKTVKVKRRKRLPGNKKEKLSEVNHLPDALVDVIRDDRYWVTKEYLVPNVMCSPTVTELLGEFCASRTGKPDLDEKTLLVFKNGMINLFNKALPLRLLYKFERFQLDELLSTNEHVSFADVYGYVHLVRCCYSLRDFLTMAKVDSSEMEILQPILDEFFEFLAEKNELASEDQYGCVLPWHFREAYGD